MATAHDDPPLRLTQVKAARFTNGAWQYPVGDWAILTPRAKLNAKYSRGGSAIFGHYVYRFPHREPHRITGNDIVAADALMGANISAQAARPVGILSDARQEQLEAVLQRIPVDASIESTAFDADVEEAIDVLKGASGVQLAIASKLLCIKRPYLIPMMDSLVQSCFGASTAREIMGELRRLLADPAIAARVDVLAQDVAAIIGAPPSRLRIVDELIWFDWNVRPPDGEGRCEVVGFPGWCYDTNDHERGVYLRAGD